MIEIINLKDEPALLPTLASWHHREWSFLNPAETLEDRIGRMQQFLNTDFIPGTFIAKDDCLLGSAAIVEHDMDNKPLLTPWLASVFVLPEHRLKGVGSKLVLHLMAQARDHGIRRLYLFTPDKQSFYLKLGWTIMCIEHYHGHEVTIMQSDLVN
jgi:N-acetylglutamate synthase-like GNAT family acetyltransferase